MKLSFDAEADSLILILSERTWRQTKRVAPGINLELDDAGEVAAIEVMELSRRAGRPALKHFTMDIAPPLDPEEGTVELPPGVASLLREKIAAAQKKAKAKA